MTPAEAFKVGFAMRCAEEGLPAEEVQARVTKAASLTKQAAGISPLAVGAAAAVPLGMGALAGYGLHSATESDINADDVRKKEIIDELKHWTRRAKLNKQLKTIPV